MISQAKQVFAKVFEAAAFTGDTMVGTISEGGAIFIAARAMFEGVKWDMIFAQLDFADGSSIQYIRDPSSMYRTTYKAV